MDGAPSPLEPMSVELKAWAVSGDEGGIQAMLHVGEGLSDDDATALVLAALRGVVYRQTVERMVQQSPMLNGDILAQLADADTTLVLMHTLLHLPEQDVSGFTT